jgi:4-hydroxybenzoate polyprenyltransferase
MKDLLRLLRPQQWYKNVLVLAGWVFSGHLLDASSALPALAGFGLFIILSSGTYALNDALDARRDREHPTKRNRPVASGRIPVPAASAIGLILVGASLVGAAILGTAFLLTAAAYFALQVAYVLALRHAFLLDLASITGGFFLRALAGVVLVGVPLSPWLLYCTLFLALFLGLGKRRHELQVLGDKAASHRRSLAGYSPAFTADAINVTAASLLVGYSLYTFFHAKVIMMATIPFVVYGLLRYLRLIHAGGGGEPDQVLRDPASLVNLLLWATAIVLVLYGPDSWDAAARRFFSHA